MSKMPTFDGKVTIRVRFRNKAEYQKFRKYVLKTGWEYDVSNPQYESLVREFHTADDVTEISKIIIELLQLGFYVWTTSYELTEIDPAELESPTDDEEEEGGENFEDWDDREED